MPGVQRGPIVNGTATGLRKFRRRRGSSARPVNDDFGAGLLMIGPLGIPGMDAALITGAYRDQGRSGPDHGRVHREWWQAPAASEKWTSGNFPLSRLRRFFDCRIEHGGIGSGVRHPPCCEGRSAPPRGARAPEGADRQRNGGGTLKISAAAAAGGRAGPARIGARRREVRRRRSSRERSRWRRDGKEEHGAAFEMAVPRASPILKE